MEKFLGIALGKLTHNHRISEDDAKILKDAKAARNYLAHKAASPYLFAGNVAKALEDEFGMVEASVRSLANGHNLLACWAYEFEEGEPRPFTLSRVYPEGVTRWIMTPVYEALQDG